ncbi:YhcN/YlaJ family sporulation lipoprotein [Dethiothermospora halolimnae]|uniref:YhcN/YlaJ family sporulation lipoprotein n=1 Tax=Dethiothermospora halolimnae TaxID=3114390 RepID=UPI003CCBDAA2
MLKNKKYLISTLVILLLLAMVSVGCQQGEEKPNLDNNNMNGTDDKEYGGNVDDDANIDDDNDMLNNNNMNNNMNENGMNNNMSARADRIANKITTMDNVDRATVIITGDTALVGVDMNGNTTGNMTTTVENDIKKMVKNTDNQIDNVSVTTDPDLFDRLDNIYESTRNGRPVSGFADEIEEIMRRITPNM